MTGLTKLRRGDSVEAENLQLPEMQEERLSHSGFPEISSSPSSVKKGAEVTPLLRYMKDSGVSGWYMYIGQGKRGSP